MHFLTLLTAGLVGLAAAAPSETHAVHEKRHAAPFAWKRHSRAVKEQVLPIRIGLKQRNLEHADRFIQDVADPDSPNYGTTRNADS
jgi:tripeptidyl-peptidase I